jgi:hypothetical protein
VIQLLANNEQALSFNIRSIDQKFPGFKPSDFAVIYGHPFCNTLLFRLCVRCQLPKEEGGLASSAIFVDGGNTFNPYAISALAREFGLHPKSTLEQVFISRAFTAYQLSALILETLENALKHHKSKLVLISSITNLFLDKDVPTKEAFEIFRKIITHVSDLALKRNIIIAATCSNGEHSKRRIILESILLGKTGTTVRVAESKGRLQLTIQNHDFPEPLTVDVSQNRATLKEFMEA